MLVRYPAMEQPPSPVLEYATPPKRRRRDPANSPPLRALGISVIVQASLAATDVKVIPGGPFISIHGEVIPALLCFVILGMGIRSLFSGKPMRRAIVATLMLISMLIALGAVSFAVSVLAGTVFTRCAYRLLNRREEVGRLSAGEDLRIELPEGEHRMVARIDWARSNCLSFGVRAGEASEIEVGANARRWLLLAAIYFATIGFRHYLYLRHRVTGFPVAMSGGAAAR